jgi:hypothetical protein
LKHKKVSAPPNLTELVPAPGSRDVKLTRAARPATTTEPKAELGDWKEGKRSGIELRRVSMADLKNLNSDKNKSNNRFIPPLDGVHKQAIFDRNEDFIEICHDDCRGVI